MTNEVTNVPELRFPGFEDGWKKEKLGDIANVQMGQSPKSQNYTDDSQEMVLVQGNADLKDGKIFPRIFTKEITKLANIGDILLSVRAPVGEIGIAQMTACIGRGVCSITSNLFTYYFLNYFNIENKWEKFSQGSTFESISGNEVRSLLIYYPSKSEQQKIGDFFSKLDRQIELEEQKLEKLKEQKKGYMQKIFSQELRFKDENGKYYPEWEEKELGDVATIVGGGTPNTKIAEYWNGDINWFSPVEIGNDIFVNESKSKITELGLKKSSAKLLPTGTVLFTSRAGIGKTAILNSEACTNQGFQSIVPNKSMLDSYYIYSRTNQLKKYAEIVGSGSTFIEVSGVQMRKMPIMLPSITEQEKIGAFFKKIDDSLKKQSDKIELLKERKQGFLQKMFV